MTIRLALVAGARPNFMKVAPLIRALRRTSGFRWRLIHTGQHYDREMSGVFFDELGIPQPNVSLECGGGTQAEQTAKTMVALERDLTAHPVDCVVVVGDVNSTVAAALAAKKLQLRLAHVEAGLRSGDRTMPEEINRLVTDSISDLFLVTEPSGIQALLREGHDPTSIRHVGNLMIDNLFHQLERLQAADPAQYQTTALKAGLERTGYGVVTLHRASNVDDRATLAGLIGALNEISRQLPLVFPVHPRTHARMQSFGLAAADAVRLTSPLSYMEFLNLWKDARVVLTDSGGLQEETTALGVKCVTMRTTTERPITLTEGSNVLAGTEPAAVVAAARAALDSPAPVRRPALWDGHSAGRVVAELRAFLQPPRAPAARLRPAVTAVQAAR